MIEYKQDTAAKTLSAEAVLRISSDSSCISSADSATKAKAAFVILQLKLLLGRFSHGSPPFRELPLNFINDLLRAVGLKFGNKFIDRRIDIFHHAAQ